MDSLDVKLNFTLSANIGKNANGGVNDFTVNVKDAQSYNFGTAVVSEANLFYSASRTLAASASENLDLSGVLTDPFGDTITAAEIVAIYIEAAAGNTNDVVVGNATSNAFVGPLGATGTYTIKAGEWVPFVSQKGWAVTAGTGDLLKVANSGAGTSVTYKIIILARSVAA